MSEPSASAGAHERASARAVDDTLFETFESALLEAAFARGSAADLLERLRAAALRLGCARFEAAILEAAAEAICGAASGARVLAATESQCAERLRSPAFVAAIDRAIAGDPAELSAQLQTRHAVALRSAASSDRALIVIAHFDEAEGAAGVQTSDWLLRMLRHVAACMRVSARAREAATVPAANPSQQRELDTFTQAIAHDLRAPLRRIQGFARLLAEDYATVLGDTGNGYVGRIGALCESMQSMCEGLLNAARSSAGELHRERVDLGVLAKRLCADLLATEPERNGCLMVRGAVVAQADAGMMRVLLENLVGNAWKFTRACAFAQIEIGVRHDRGAPVYFVRDNGVGFDMAYSHKLFSPFARLHSEGQYPGTGLGLATVQRIVARHGGRIWAESAPDAGACFHFTLEPDPTASPTTARTDF